MNLAMLHNKGSVTDKVIREVRKGVMPRHFDAKQKIEERTLHQIFSKGEMMNSLNKCNRFTGLN